MLVEVPMFQEVARCSRHGCRRMEKWVLIDDSLQIEISPSAIARAAAARRPLTPSFAAAR